MIMNARGAWLIMQVSMSVLVPLVNMSQSDSLHLALHRLPARRAQRSCMETHHIIL